MDLVLPETDPAEVYPQVRIRFLAEARDEKGNDVSDRATFTWTFPDAEDSTVGNPVLHRFPELGKSLVSVTATLDSDSGCAETTVIVIPYEGGGGLRQAPGAGNFAFTANGHETGHEVSDDVTLLVEMVEDIGPWWWGVGEFQRYENGQWITPENQGWGEAYGWFTTLGDPHNGPVQWRARVMVDEIGADPPNGFDFHLLGTWTVVNTVVKSASPPLIFHHAEDTSHTIAWDLTHCEDFDPHFTMTVTIYDLGGATVATLVRYNVPLEEENPQIVWNTNLPEEDGIYAYRIHASHYDEPGFPFYPCVDQDKPGALETTLDKFYWFDKDPVAGTLRGVVKYALNVDAYSGSVTIRFYGPDLGELDGALEYQDEVAGTHFSDVYELDVDYDENDELIGPIYCVILGGEGEDYAANNRDREPKPAVQMGSSALQQVTVSLTADIPEVAADPNPPGADTTLKHFVTPQGGAEDVVTLTASISQDEAYLKQFLDWEGATEDAQDPLKATAPINAAAKHVVKIKLGGALVKEARVWVVWADVSLDTYSPDVLVTVFRKSTAVELAEPIYMDHDIRPVEIITDTNRPDLNGGSVSSPPVANQAENCWHHGVALPDGVWRRWDASRRLRIVLHNPNGVSFADEAYECVHGMRYWDNWPDWPDDPAVGNDDRTWTDEEDDPYTAIQQPPKPVGSLKSWDRPRQGTLADTGDVGDVVILRFYFQEFTRLELGEEEEAQWYCISDPFAWHVFFALRKVSEAVEGQDYDGDGQLDDEVWVDNGSSIGLD